MAKLTHKKIAGSTVIEVLIAMVIIMLVFSIAMRLFGNVMHSGVSFKKVQVQQQLYVLAKEIQQVGFISNEVLSIDSVDYHFATDTTAIDGLAKLSIKAYQKGNLLGNTKCYYHVKEKAFED